MASPTTIINFKGFKQFFKDIISSYIIQNDTYRDENDEGIFERYMALFGESLDEEQARHIDDYLKIIDASLCDEKYLAHISDVLGNPPDIFKSVEQYRNLLSYITNVYKVKGTVRGYKLFFYILGFDVEITNLQPVSNALQYDTGKRYDDGHKYDEEGCQSCSFYTINIKRIDGSQYLLDANTIELFKNAIEFNEPINAKLSKFLVTVTLEDELNIIDLSEELTSIEQTVTPINCVLSDWGPWGPCRPDSTQVRTRTILTQPYAGGTPCGPLEETRACQLPVDCVLSGWSDWSECIDESQTRTRTIITAPLGGGAPCGPTTETRACTLPVDCVLSEWSEWGPCIDGNQTRTKTIITQPKGAGAPCGPTTETRTCTTPVELPRVRSDNYVDPCSNVTIVLWFDLENSTYYTHETNMTDTYTGYTYDFYGQSNQDNTGNSYEWLETIYEAGIIINTNITYSPCSPQ